MDYFVYYVGGNKAFEYLGGTNYVGVWSLNQYEANAKVKKYFEEGTPIISTPRSKVEGKIGYLH